ncbi:hypothetical protein GQ457_04G005210 [Hibiscus cannabinus]
MSSGAGSKAWFIAASGVGGVEGLKDKGFCRWNIHAIRSINQRACCNLRSYSQPENLSSSSSSSSSVVSREVRDEKAKEGEESLRKVIFFHFNMSSSSSSTERPRNLQMELYCKVSRPACMSRTVSGLPLSPGTCLLNPRKLFSRD